MWTYQFWIKRTHSSEFEKIQVQAASSWEAVSLLPNCVYWDFVSSLSVV